MKIFVKLLIVRNHFIRITSSKPHLVCTLFNKLIDVRKCETKFGSVRLLLVCLCMSLYPFPLDITLI